MPGGWRDAAYLLALAGFGFKAGLVPLHVWLPEAHPVAPAEGSAFLSGLVVKLGVYGIALFAFRLLPRAGLARDPHHGRRGGHRRDRDPVRAHERDIKRFLAFSTIENIGIIVIAFGAAMIFHAYRQPALWAFLLIAGLYHVANHGCYKTLLFLEAGVVEHATGTRDMDRLGGLVHRLPRSTVITFVGTLGIAALPPLNGFVSEWLIFQGLFQGFRTGSHLIAILIVLAAATLGLTGGLAIYAFVRGFGIPFLGMPRTRQAADAQERGQPVAGPALLAVACVALAVGAPIVLAVLSRASHGHRRTLRPVLLPGNLTVIPAHTNFSGFSPTYLAVFLLAVMAVPALIYLAGRPRPRACRCRSGTAAWSLPAPHAVLRHDILRAHPGHLRRAVPASGFGPPRLRDDPAGVRPGALRITGDPRLRAVPVPAGDPRRRVARRCDPAASVRRREPVPVLRIRDDPARLPARRGVKAERPYALARPPAWLSGPPPARRPPS